jgi:hypothetical protein
MAGTIEDIEIDGDLYDIRYFFDADQSEDGIDIHRADDGAHIGEMMGKRFPDPDDEDDMDYIRKELKDWLDNNI